MLLLENTGPDPPYAPCLIISFASKRLTGIRRDGLFRYTCINLVACYCFIFIIFHGRLCALVRDLFYKTFPLACCLLACLLLGVHAHAVAGPRRRDIFSLCNRGISFARSDCTIQFPLCIQLFPHNFVGLPTCSRSDLFV